MKALHILNKREVRGIEGLVRTQWNATLPPSLVVLRSPSGRLYVTRREVFALDYKKLRIDSMGLYIGTVVHHELRLSIEGSQLIGPSATKNVLDMSREQMQRWLRGHDIPVTHANSGFLLVRSGPDFLGCGKIKNEILLNFYPKSRRITSALENSS